MYVITILPQFKGWILWYVDCISILKWIVWEKEENTEMKPVEEAQKDVKKSISGLLLTERFFLMCCWSLNNSGSNCV